MPTVANVPMNQINALPILSIDAASTPPSTVVVTGTGKIIRTWLPAVSGINGQSSNVADPRGDPNAYLITNWLDLTGMSAVTLMLGVETPAPFAGDVLVSWTVRAIPMCTAGGVTVDPTPFLPGPNTRNMTGVYASAAAAPFPVVGVMGVPALTGLAGVAIGYKLATCGWGIGTNSTGSHVGIPVNGVFKLLFIGGGADPLLNYLTVIASS